jgi:peptide/nickel transport system ATP-binding protein
VTLLEVTDLHVSFPTADGLVQAVRGVSFAVDTGQTLGIVGESGSGKSVATQTIMGLTKGARITGEALFEGKDLLRSSAHDMRRIRGAKIGMIFQDPLTSLHPYYRVGWQIVEMIRAHEPDTSKSQARKRAIELLGLVGIPQAERRVDDFPHQFSGGMRQRAMIAMAMALNPTMLIADEPTTALDVTVQAQVLQVMQRLQQEFGTAIVLITHDLGVVADMADDIVVMYAGTAMEKAARRTLFYERHNPYTEGLLESLPAYGDDRVRLVPIAGQPPSLINLGVGCPFSPRCPYVFEKCIAETPPLREVAGPRHVSACWLPVDSEGRASATKTRTVAADGTVVAEAPVIAEAATTTAAPRRRASTTKGTAGAQSTSSRRGGRHAAPKAES